MTGRRALGVLSIGAGLVLLLFFRDAQYEWFQGGWMGLALVALGGLDLVEGARRSYGHRSTSVLGELKGEVRDALGSKERRDNDNP